MLFDRKTLNPELTTGEIPGTLYGMSDTGWMIIWREKHDHSSIHSGDIAVRILMCPEIGGLLGEQKVSWAVCMNLLYKDSLEFYACA